MVVSSLRSSSSPHGSGGYYHASHSRADDWNQCCAKVMGFEDWALVDVVTDEKSSHHLQVTNLLPSELFEDDDDDDDNDDEVNDTIHHDPWTENALNIQADLDRMAAWIMSKKLEFIGFDMDANEASLIQSTVTSFAATTANEIESLRKMASSSVRNSSGNSSSGNQVHHRTGIVQILLARLKEDVVEPFGVLQKHRSRQAVNLWQNPLQCKLLVKKRKQQQNQKTKTDDAMDQALGLLDDEEDIIPSSESKEADAFKEQRFIPRRESHQLRNKFMDTYTRDEQIATSKLLSRRPKSLIRDPLSVLSTGTETVFDPNVKEHSPQQSPQHQQQHSPQQQQPRNSHTSTSIIPGIPDYQYEEMTQAAQDQIQQEALMLQAMVHSDLDSVQKVEQQMVIITKLLSQFSDLVQEQSEEVWQIHDTAKDTKKNMQDGQNQLTDAAERTYTSQHYMAKGIFAAGCLLLLFHWLRP